MDVSLPSACDVLVRAVASRGDRREFLRLPRRICRHRPQWVEPLRLAQARLLDRRRHPFYDGGRGAEAELFLARAQGGEPVGRIAAILNHRYDAHLRARTGDRPPTGFFGFFDCIDAPDAARALIASAGEWLRRRGAREMFGPASPSQAYEYGLLVEGHDRPHRFLAGWHPPYYAELLSSAGLQKAKDLLTLSLALDDERYAGLIEAFFGLAGAFEADLPPGLAIRTIAPRRLAQEVEMACGLFNRVLGDHWGYAPICRAELRDMARSLRPFLLPGALVVAEHDGRPAGGALAVPDLNELLARLRLRTQWLAPLELLLRNRRWRPGCVRVLAAGVDPEYRWSGVILAIIRRLGRNLLARGVRRIDAHLVLEDNQAVLNPLRRYGFREDRRHRIFRGEL